MEQTFLESKIAEIFQRGDELAKVLAALATENEAAYMSRKAMEPLIAAAQDEMLVELNGTRTNEDTRKSAVQKILARMPEYQRLDAAATKAEMKKQHLQFRREALESDLKSLRGILALATAEQEALTAQANVQAARHQAQQAQNLLDAQKVAQATAPRHIQ